MYVYIQSETELWTVGFYGPDGKWNPESDHASADEAVARVHWLNGGRDEPAAIETASDADILRIARRRGLIQAVSTRERGSD